MDLSVEVYTYSNACVAGQLEKHFGIFLQKQISTHTKCCSDSSWRGMAWAWHGTYLDERIVCGQIFVASKHRP
jgi:hypothetical protein